MIPMVDMIQRILADRQVLVLHFVEGSVNADL